MAFLEFIGADGASIGYAFIAADGRVEFSRRLRRLAAEPVWSGAEDRLVTPAEGDTFLLAAFRQYGRGSYIRAVWREGEPPSVD